MVRTVFGNFYILVITCYYVLLVFTLHAKEQMVARGVSKQQVLDCIRRGSKVKQTDGLLASYGYIQIAYKVRGEMCVVKTVMIR